MKTPKRLRLWFEEKRDMIVAGLILLVVVISIILGLKMQRNYALQQRIKEEAVRTKQVKLSERRSGQISDTAEQKQTKSRPRTSYFLKPSPEDVLSLIKETGATELPPNAQKYTGFPVMWPAYFFQIVDLDAGKATVLLDVSEDGFGVMIQADVDINRFPQIMNTERGRKIWVAGEIQGVEGTGTGKIIIAVDEVRFDENLMDAIKGTSAAADKEQESAETMKGEAK